MTTTATKCATCAYHDRLISREVRRNERRARDGKPVDMTAIERAKADKARCAELGHHNPQAGPTARWGRRS